jgi:hypothetical protein
MDALALGLALEFARADLASWMKNVGCIKAPFGCTDSHFTKSFLHSFMKSRSARS